MTDRWAIARYAVTGGTGFLGRAIIRRLLADGSAERIVSVARDEVKRDDLLEEFGHDPRLRAMLGDVRDRERMEDAFAGCQAVIHAAALKRVGTGAYDADEMTKTNILGTRAVIRAALAAGVERLIVVSSDKACEPTNHYGKTKAAAEDLAVNANTYAYPRGLRIGCVRYGNVLGSRGSVLELWDRQLAEGNAAGLTDARMTRFIITIEQAVHFVLDAAYDVEGGEIFVPVLPAARIEDLFVAFYLAGPMARGADLVRLGFRPGGEKLHERLLTDEEASHRLADAGPGRYAVLPTHREWSAEPYPWKPTTLDAPYDSGTAPKLTYSELLDMMRGLAA